MHRNTLSQITLVKKKYPRLIFDPCLGQTFPHLSWLGLANNPLVGTHEDGFFSSEKTRVQMLYVSSCGLTTIINPLIAKLFNLNFHPLEVVSR